MNWDREYGAWRGAGLTVDAFIQFTAKTQPPSTWDDTQGSASRFGHAFARHFGPTQGTGHVRPLEVGNEPWDYQADSYAQMCVWMRCVTVDIQILEGMASGAKQGDAAMLILPGAFQAHDKFAETAPSANYIGTRGSANASTSIDAINGHYYSYSTTSNGVRQATFPEHPSSSFNGVRNLLRWRDVNMAGTPVWITEWGWDSDGAGESCGFPECVSEDAVAVYGLRGLMIMARLGVERARWFFFANDKSCHTHVYCRNGLTGSKSVGFTKKKVFFAFQDLLSNAGDMKFMDVVKEDSTAYVYLFGNYAAYGNSSHASSDSSPAHSAVTTATHVVAWYSRM